MTLGVTVEIGTGALLLYGIPFIIIVGWFSSRILGVRRGWGRSLVAGFVGWTVGVVMAAVVQDQDVRSTGDVDHVIVLAFFIGLIVSMFVGLILDIILKPKVKKRHRFRPLLHPIATVKRKFAPLGRSREILHYARKRGLTHRPSAARLATPDFARRLRLTLEDCGGMFVKFGQIASTRTDLLPEVLTDELATLQSSARPVPPDDVRDVIENELGASVEEEFASFDFEPLAAASIGQTHRAVLKTGEHVVVKVQRPGIEDIVHRDAAVLRIAASTAERRVEAARLIGIKRLAEELITSLERELDYGAEASSGEVFLEHVKDDDGIAAPMVYQALSTRRVLVMEEIQGVTVADRAEVEAAPVGARVLAIRLLHSFLDQVLRDGMYHADPHPGNIFIDHRGTLWFLDFGAVGRLSPVILESLQEMAIGFQLKDPVLLARAGRRLSGGDESTDNRALEADIGLVLTDGLDTGSFDPKAMSEMLEILVRHGLEVPTAMTVLSRALLTLEGTLRTIDPSFNLAHEATELMPEFAEQQHDQMQEQLQKEFLRALPSLRTLPGHMEGIATQLRGGRLSMRVERYAGDDRAVVDAWIDRIIFAAIGIVGLVTSALFLVAAAVVLNHDEDFGNILRVVGFFGLTVCAIIEMRVVAQILRRESDEATTRRV
jgi:ubiquinone biosynthesis protein